MSSSGGVSIARTAIRGENRFYNPPAMRRMQQEAQLQQQLREKQQRDGQEGGEGEVDKEPKASLPPPPTTTRTRKSQGKNRNRVVSGGGSEVSVGSSGSSGSGRVQVRREGSNLDRFLEHTTPVVPARCLPTQRSKRELKTGESPESHTYFVLEDLWESFAEWSAYGAGVPLHMDGSDSTIQYYVPYLSGIQLYVVDPSKKARNTAEDSEGSSSRLDKLPNNGKTLESGELVDLSVSELNRVSLGDQSGETETSNPQGRLLFEYLEYEPPFGREPLANKVLDLASRFPELMTYRSCDLSPSSWVSVSWYPIYRIPVGATLQNLDACFLTFHSLSTPPPPLKAGALEPSVKLPLPTFGLASYKLKLSVWNQSRAQECQKISSLQQAADKWLKRLQVNHPDYKFFTSNIPPPQTR
ncbi:uncharacterized protein LOC108837178 isoform X1 [Raphanus sativus]|uniref:Uncharacterized protein LOC108837178 isoform X1 n=1 Tax=Raphanus sativus TaxID=3726 RepID=A0A9W3BX26_RAPSA|nr:uncharacterized protein LOC108837178 isoform X1 [Raphanus sativus]